MRYGSPAVTARGGGGRGGHDGVRGALTRYGAVVKRPGDDGKTVVIEGALWGRVRRERGGKDGGVGCGEVRRGWGAFYRCRVGGR
jgi:hypothetical protein